MKVFLNFSSNLDGTMSRVEFSEPDFLQQILVVHLRFLGMVTNLGEIISFALSFTLWNSDASIFVHLLNVCYQKSSFPNFPSRVPDVFEV